MLDKIKGLMQVKDEIDKVTTSCNDNSKAVSELTEEIRRLKTAYKENLEMQQRFVEMFHKSMEEVDNLKEDLAKEVYDFKLLKGELQKKILEKSEEAVKDEISNSMKKLEQDAAAYNEVRLKVNSIISNLDALSSEMDKFSSISRQLKKEDFELTKFANKIFDEDKEKLRLMKQLDTMERLVAKMRRRP